MRNSKTARAVVALAVVAACAFGAAGVQAPPRAHALPAGAGLAAGAVQGGASAEPSEDGLAALVAQAIQALAQPDYSWYDASATSFTLSDGADEGTALVNKLVGFANIVNGQAAGAGIAQDDFAGKTVTLGGNANFLGLEWAPVGTAEHPFAGTFDGDGHELRNFKVTDCASEAGFFGVTAEGSRLLDVSVAAAGGAGVAVGTADHPYEQGKVHHVGSLAGRCEGSISGCSSDMPVRIVCDSPVSAELPIIVDAVGGLAGSCRGGLSDCEYSGSVDVFSASEASAGGDQGYLIMQCIGGVVGFFGDIDAPASTTATVKGCINRGTVKVNTAGYASGDRFGEPVVAQAGYVGGVVGYTTGSVERCRNEGAVDTSYQMTTRIYGTALGAAGSYLGGVVGSLRGAVIDGMTPAVAGSYDAGTGGQDNPVHVRECANTGTVFGNHAVGGVVGESGWFSHIEGCYCSIPTGGSAPPSQDDYDDADAYEQARVDYLVNVGGVKAARWNKPMGGGIVGKCYGTVSYCYNRSRVWSTTDGGYYIAGIAGVLFRGSSIAGHTAPLPEMWACYNTGFAQSGLRAASIAGQNEGFIHDCYALHETSYYNPKAGEAEKLVFSQYATVSRSDFSSADDLAGSATAGKLNYLAPSEGWQTYFVPNGNPEVNDGFPLLSWQDVAGDAIDLAALPAGAVTVELSADADYTGKAAEPLLKVTLAQDGTTVQLAQNADFRVLVDPAAADSTLAADRTTGSRPYTARIVGMGRYVGVPDAAVNYGVVVGDLSACTMVVGEHVYTGQPVQLGEGDVMLVGKSGNVVPSECYTFTVGDGQDCSKRGTYWVEARATDAGGSNYTGTCRQKALVVAPADLYSDCAIQGVSFGGSTYVGDQLDDMHFTYTGDSVYPTIDAITYAPAGAPAMVLKPAASATSAAGDYYVSYLSDGDYVNATGGERTRNVTVESTLPDSVGNFHNYVQLQFAIDPADLSRVEITTPDQAYTGQPRGVVQAVYNGRALVEGVDYEVDYENNVERGSAAVAHIRGIGNFKGAVDRTFSVLQDAPVDIAGATIADIPRQSWTGQEVKPPVQVSMDGRELVEGVDYVLRYRNNVDAADASASPAPAVDVVGCGAYGGTRTVPFTIAAHAVSFAQGFGLLPDGSRYATPYLDGEQMGRAGQWASATRGPGAEVQLTLDRSDGFNQKCNLVGAVVVGATSGEEVPVQVVSRSYKRESGGVCTVVCSFDMPDEDVVVSRLVYVRASKDLSACTMQVPDQTYTGSPLVPAPVVRDGATVLQEGVDYGFLPNGSYLDNVAAGTATVKVVGFGDYAGSLSGTFQIASVEAATVRADDVSVTYDGEPHGVVATSDDASLSIRYGTEEGVYDLEQSPTFTQAGTYTVYFRASGAGKVGVGSATVTVLPRNAVVRARPAAKRPGDPDPAFGVELEGVLPADRASIAYTGPERPGAGTDESEGTYAGAIRVSGAAVQGSYRLAYECADFTISADAAMNVSVSGDVATYDGRLHGIVVTPLVAAGKSPVVTYGPTEATCVDLNSPRYADAGTYTVHWKVICDGYADLHGTTELVVQRAPLTVTADDVVRSFGDANPPSSQLHATVSGLVGDDQVQPVCSVLGVSATDPVGAYGGAVRVDLPEDPANYDVSYVRGTLVVQPRDISDANVSDLRDFTYSASKVTPVPDVACGGRTLVRGTDFTVAYRNAVGAETAAPTAAGTYAVIVQGCGNYTGQAATSFVISRRSIAGASVGKVQGFTYNASARSQAPTVKLGSLALSAGTDYAVGYQNAAGAAIPQSQVKAAGTYYVVVSGRGNFAGTARAKFAIAKAPNPVKVQKTAKIVKQSKLKKKAVTVQVLKVTKRQGTLTCTNASTQKAAKKFKVARSTGKVTVPKGTKKGTYTVKVKLKVAGNANYKPFGAKTYAVKVRVK